MQRMILIPLLSNLPHCAKGIIDMQRDCSRLYFSMSRLLSQFPVAQFFCQLCNLYYIYITSSRKKKKKQNQELLQLAKLSAVLESLSA